MTRLEHNSGQLTCAGQSAHTGRFGSRVCREIDSILEEQNDPPTIANVAARLSENVRTLQRRLGEEELVFRDLVASCRRRAALEALEEGSLPIATIAANLGYSHPAHFSRAFRAWTGQSPSSFQKRK